MNPGATQDYAETHAAARKVSETTGRGSMSRTAIFALLASLGAWLHLRLFLFLKTPFLLSGDQVYFSLYGQRLLLGERMYWDFFHFTPPGADLMYAAAFWVFGARAWVPNAVVLALGILLGAIVLYIARNIMDSRAAILTTCLTVLVYGYMENGTHHWFSVVSALAGTAILMRSLQKTRLMVAGAFFALACFFTQTTGVAALAGTIVFLAVHTQRSGEPRKRFVVTALWVLATFIATSLLLNAYFLIQSGPALLWYCQVSYVTHYFLPSLERFSWWLGSEVTSWRDLPLAAISLLGYALLPATYAIALWRYFKPRPSHEPIPSPLLLICLVGTFMFLETARAPNWVRLLPASIPGLIVLVALGTRQLSRRLVFMAAMSIIAIAAGKMVFSVQHSHPLIAELRTGRAAIASVAKYDKLQWLTQRTTPEEWFYQACGPPTSYLPLGLRSPSYVSELFPDKITRPEFVSQIVNALEKKQVHFVLLNSCMDTTAAGNADNEDNLGPLRTYLRSHYQLVKTFADHEEAWERNPIATTASMQNAASGGLSRE